MTSQEEITPPRRPAASDSGGSSRSEPFDIPVGRAKRVGWADASRAIADSGDDALVWPECGNAGDDDLTW